MHDIIMIIIIILIIGIILAGVVMHIGGCRPGYTRAMPG